MMRAEELERIEAAIGSVLHERDFKLDRVAEGSRISTILTIKNQKVGFAGLDGHVGGDYSSPLEEFRRIYAAHAREWSKDDLTLVLCRLHEGQPSDEVCNKIEIDPYFCRKFVIDLTGDLEAELRRLPFIPLATQIIATYEAPPDARAFLTEHGMSPDLARYLVVPGNRGVGRIVDDNLQNKLGDPQWRDAATRASGIVERQKGKRVRLMSLEIKNFRAYREPRTFELNANLVVLFGPNGLGKTSFFDALDFACTGSVARFEERFHSNAERLCRALRHLDSLDVDSFVGVTISSDGDSEEVVRTMADRLGANINGSPADRTQTIIKFAGLSSKLTRTHVDHLVHLFRASHLFGQEFQSLTSGFRMDSVLPQDVVSRMLAFQDYVEGVNKVGKVIDELKKRSQAISSRIQELERSRRQKENDLAFLTDSMPQLDTGAPAEPAIALMGKALAERTQRLLVPDVVDVSKGVSKESVRFWYGLVSAQVQSSEQQVALLGDLENRLFRLQDFQNTLEDDKARLKIKRETKQQAENNLKLKRDILDSMNGKLGQEHSELAELTARRDNFTWWLGAKKGYEESRRKYQDVEDRIMRIQRELAQSDDQLLSIGMEKATVERKIEELTGQIEPAKKTREQLDALQDNLAEWSQLTQSLASMTIGRNKLEEEQNSVSANLKQTQQELALVNADLENCEARLSDMEKQQSELKALLDGIRRHINHNICPVCGHSYESEEELLKRLEIQRGEQPKEISQTLQVLQDKSLKKTQLNALSISFSARLIELKVSVERELEAQANVEHKLADYVKRAESISMPTELSAFTSCAGEKRLAIQREVDEKLSQLNGMQSTLSELERRINDLKQIDVGLKLEMQQAQSAREQCSVIIEGLKSEANKRSLYFESDEGGVTDGVQKLTARIKALQESIASEDLKCSEIRNEVSQLNQQTSALLGEIDALDRRLNEFRNQSAEVEHCLKKLNLGQAVDSAIIARKAKLEIDRLEAESLREDLAKYEIVLNVAVTSPLIARAKNDIQSTTEEMTALQTKNALIAMWDEYYRLVSQRLEALQRQSLDMYTQTYGPLTRNIQRRLRSVYGFGDIRLESVEGGIAVRVERKGQKNIAPTDYFSESQVQIVMLGLFLSAALTQTWSSFNPILMDDPVEHFDNLNAYSFVDLIKGLIENDDNIQFIVSTCDERLFRLIQQKFLDSNIRTIFHVFESIGDDGPHFATKCSEPKKS